MPLIAAAAIALAGCVASPVQDATATVAPLPLDPLTDDERLRAVETALDDPDVAAALADVRYRVIGASLHTEKARILAGDHTRFADVHIYRYGSDEVVWPVVDLTAGRVASVTIETFQPRLTEEEIDEAHAFVVDDPRVRAQVPNVDEASVIAILRSPDIGGCLLHRCIEMMFMDGSRPVSNTLALFDLSDRIVVDVWDAAARGQGVV